MIDTMSDTPLGLTEIGELLGVSRQRAFTLSKRADFPPPTATLKAGRIWDRAAIEAWETTWDRSNQGGRPKQKKAVENAPPEPDPEPIAEEEPAQTAPEPEVEQAEVKPPEPEVSPTVKPPWPAPLPDRAERARAQMGIAQWIQELDDETTLSILDRARHAPRYDDLWRFWAGIHGVRWAGLMVLHADQGDTRKWLDELQPPAE
jgi:predicted DNA-binding transcriptional regulator AlpA